MVINSLILGIICFRPLAGSWLGKTAASTAAAEAASQSFRPLAGSWLGKETPNSHLTGRLVKVSVPVRGVG